MSLSLPEVPTEVRPEHVPGALPALQPGRIVELHGAPGSGLTRLGFRLLAEPSRRVPVVYLDVRGWVSPLAAWEVGVDRSRLVVVRCPDARMWLQVAAVLCEGVRVLMAEVPRGVSDRDLRRLAALIRARGVRVALRPVDAALPSGVAHLRMRGLSVEWAGVDRGHGRLMGRRLTCETSGKGVAGMERRIEVEDLGADDVRVVSGVVAREVGRAV